MNILAQLNSGAIHKKARASRADCVDALGNIHGSASRAQFVNWRLDIVAAHGQDPDLWPDHIIAEHKARYVPSH